MHEKISRDPARDYHKATLAAGAVLWRGEEVAIIHRPRYDDWSLPKGKVDPGEALPTTATREITEETGYEVFLGAFISRVEYPVKDRTKVVFYWNSEVTGGEFRGNEEVDELRWVSPKDAAEQLTYGVDREVLATAQRVPRGDGVSRVLYVRHARAHQRRNWAGDDNLRPLDKKGRKQAAGLAHTLACFAPDRIYAALPARCQATVAPLAEALELDIAVEEVLGDTGWIQDHAAATNRFREIATQPATSVICSQGLAMPSVLEQLTGTTAENLPMKKGSCWVLTFQDGALVDWDYQASALPVK